MKITTLMMLSVCAWPLGACHYRSPVAVNGTSVAVIGQRGDVLTGVIPADSPNGTFEVTNGSLSCRGRYNAALREPVIDFTTFCSDGRQGLGRAQRDANLKSGRGAGRMDDGEEVRFLFGPEAAALVPKTRGRVAGF